MRSTGSLAGGRKLYRLRWARASRVAPSGAAARRATLSFEEVCPVQPQMRLARSAAVSGQR